MKIYLAGPFFNEKELSIVKYAEDILEQRGFTVFSPRKYTVKDVPENTPEWSREMFQADRTHIDKADAVVMLYHGQYSDSGTAWECGYAYACGIPVIVVQLGEASNLMVHEGSRASISMEELNTYDFTQMPEKIYTGPMF